MTTGQISLPLDCKSIHCEANNKQAWLPASYNPATWYEAMKRTIKLRQKRRIDRDAFNTLLGLDDRALTDIGVKREDVLWASRLPLSFNAAQELEKLK